MEISSRTKRYGRDLVVYGLGLNTLVSDIG